MPEDKKPPGTPIEYKVKDSRFRPLEHSQAVWFVYVEEGTPYKALFQPSYWSFVQDKLQPGAMIRVFPDEGSYMADLVVRAIGVGGVKVSEYFKREFADEGQMPASLMSLYLVKYAGPYHKWRVERKSDGAVIQTGFENEGTANAWLATNVKSLIVPEAA